MEYEVNYDLILDNTTASDVTNTAQNWTGGSFIMAQFGTYQGQLSYITPQQYLPFNSTLAPGQNVLVSGTKNATLPITNTSGAANFLIAGTSFEIMMGNYNSYTSWFDVTTSAPAAVNIVFKVNSLRVRILPTANIQVIGGILDINQYVPLKIKQSDYIKSIFQMYL